MKSTNLFREGQTVRVVWAAHWGKLTVSFMLKFFTKFDDGGAAIFVDDILTGAALHAAVLTVNGQFTNLLAQGYVVHYVFRRLVIYWTYFVYAFSYTRLTECVLKYQTFIQVSIDNLIQHGSVSEILQKH